MAGGENEQEKPNKVKSRRMVAAKMVMLDAPYGAGLRTQLEILEDMSDEQVVELDASVDKEAKKRLRQ